jgi:hypothetical protein
METVVLHVALAFAFAMVAELCWFGIARLMKRVVKFAASKLPEEIRVQSEEQWLADFDDVEGNAGKVWFAVGLVWGQYVIRRDRELTRSTIAAERARKALRFFENFYNALVRPLLVRFDNSPPGGASDPPLSSTSQDDNDH